MKINLDYNLIGEKGPVVLFLHGWGMNKNCFEKLVPKLKPNQKIICPDFFGFGESSEPEKYFDTYEYAYHIFVFLKKIKVNKIIIVGHSFGGRVAIILSSMFDINIVGIILTSSAGINLFNLKTFLKIKSYKIAKKLKHINLVKNKLDKFGSVDYKKSQNSLRCVFVKVVNQDLKFLLKYISIPCVLVWDKKDKETPYKICKVLKRGISNSQTVLFNSGGHFAFLFNQNKFADIINQIIYELS